MVKSIALCLVLMREAAVLSAQRAAYFLPHAGQSLDLQEILNFADVINNADVSNLDITIGTYENKNVFRKDEVKEFGNLDALLQNAPEKEQNMFKIPKVIN